LLDIVEASFCSQSWRCTLCTLNIPNNSSMWAFSSHELLTMVLKIWWSQEKD